MALSSLASIELLFPTFISSHRPLQVAVSDADSPRSTSGCRAGLLDTRRVRSRRGPCTLHSSLSFCCSWSPSPAILAASHFCAPKSSIVSPEEVPSLLRDTHGSLVRQPPEAALVSSNCTTTTGSVNPTLHYLHCTFVYQPRLILEGSPYLTRLGGLSECYPAQTAAFHSTTSALLSST